MMWNWFKKKKSVFTGDYDGDASSDKIAVVNGGALNLRKLVHSIRINWGR